MSFASIKIPVVSKLESISGLSHVYPYASSKIEGFPAVIVYMADNENEYGDTCHNFRTYGVMVKLFIEQNEWSEESAENLAISLVDTIISEFDEDFILGGACELVRAVETKWGWSELSNGKQRTVEIKLEIRKLENIN